MKWLITGGSGFIGANLVSHLVESGEVVSVIDDLSRRGSELNASFLANKYGILTDSIDVSNKNELWNFLSSNTPFDVIVNLAGQVSMVQSIKSPLRDFEINVIGTLNLLEFIRASAIDVAFIGMSSNKIYGDLSGVIHQEANSRFVCPGWEQGFDESLPLDFRTPYGCSKGSADQYIADYAEMYELRAISLRQSSVYGPLQHPMNDQGWVSFLTKEAMAGRQITLNGNGKQVRDLLFVEDLAYLIKAIPMRLQKGQRYQLNVGGGASNSLSILELFELLYDEFGIEAKFQCGEPRISDQKVFVSSNKAICDLTGWVPTTGVKEGVSKLVSDLRLQEKHQ